MVEGETDSVVDAEDRRLVDADDVFGYIVEDKNFAILEHYEADIFMVVEVLISYVDVGDRFLLQFMPGVNRGGLFI